jgi:hypothetical protein
VTPNGKWKIKNGKWQIVFKTYPGTYNDQIHTPGIVKLYESSGRAGGLPKGELGVPPILGSIYSRSASRAYASQQDTVDTVGG